MHNVKVELSIA